MVKESPGRRIYINILHHPFRRKRYTVLILHLMENHHLPMLERQWISWSGSTRSWGIRAPSQYKYGLSRVWRFPCWRLDGRWDRFIFNMGIPILVRRYLYIETAPRIVKLTSFSLIIRRVNITPACRLDIGGLMAERRNTCALAVGLRLSCTNPSTCIWQFLN